MVSRRTFILAGVAGGAALTVAYWLRRSGNDAPTAPEVAPLARLNGEAPTIVAAIVPALLAGALPSGDDARAAAVNATVADVARAVAGLPPAAQRELGQLFALLDFAPARIALAGITAPWPDASERDVAAFLERWQTSRFALLRSAYGALHQLVFGAWYAKPEHWAAIGYAGPPALAG